MARPERRRRGRPLGSTDPQAAEQLRYRILTGAAEAFGRKGYARTRVEDILESAAVSRPTYYRFFRDKDGAWRALAAMAYDNLVQGIEGAVTAGANPVLNLDAVVRAYIGWRLSMRAFGPVLDAESRIPGSFAGEKRKAALGGISSFLNDELVKAGRKASDPYLRVGIMAALEDIGAELVRIPDPPDTEVERARRIMMRILVGILAEPGERIIDVSKLG